MKKSQDGYFWDQVFPSLRFAGEGTKAFLHGQTSGNLNSLAMGSLLQTCWLNETGKVRALLEIRTDLEGADVLVLGGSEKDLVVGLEKVIFPADQVRFVSTGKTRRIQLLDSYTSGKSSEVFWITENTACPKDWTALKKASSYQFERWRLEQGLPLGEGEIVNNNNPFELGLGAWINLDKGCYLGQETLAKVANASGLKQQLRFWKAESQVPAGAELVKKSLEDGLNRRAGLVTSAIKDFETGGSLGLAMVRRNSLSEKELFINEGGEKIILSVPLGFVGIPT